MITPPDTPIARRCRRLRLPDQPEWLAAYNGQLADMMNPKFWEQIDTGDLTPEQAAAIARQVFFDYRDDGDDWCMAGRIFAWAAFTPPKNALLCNGQLVPATQYPALAEVLGVDDDGMIAIPDMRARFLLGAGNYPAVDAPDDNIGIGIGSLQNNTWNHQLSVGELPPHTHTQNPHTHIDAGHTHAEGIAAPSVQEVTIGVPAPAAVPGVGITGVGTANIQQTTATNQSTGNGEFFRILPRSYGVEFWMSTR